MSFRVFLDGSESSAVEAGLGQSIRLLCKAGSSRFSRVEWQKDGRPVSSDRWAWPLAHTPVVEPTLLKPINTTEAYILEFLDTAISMSSGRSSLYIIWGLQQNIAVWSADQDSSHCTPFWRTHQPPLTASVLYSTPCPAPHRIFIKIPLYFFKLWGSLKPAAPVCE